MATRVTVRGITLVIRFDQPQSDADYNRVVSALQGIAGLQPDTLRREPVGSGEEIKFSLRSAADKDRTITAVKQALGL